MEPTVPVCPDGRNRAPAPQFSPSLLFVALVAVANVIAAVLRHRLRPALPCVLPMERALALALAECDTPRGAARAGELADALDAWAAAVDRRHDGSGALVAAAWAARAEVLRALAPPLLPTLRVLGDGAEVSP